MITTRRAAALRLLVGWALVGLVIVRGGPAAAQDTGRFTEVARDLGIDFVHRHFGTGLKYMPENMAPGVALFDYDGDGRLDLYLVQGAPLVPEAVVDDRPSSAPATNRLLRQRIDGRFDDVTGRAGVGDDGYGMGAAHGDYDGDGDLDLYVTNFGPNVLYRNNGDGTFDDVTVAAGVGDARWSASAGFFDADGDGDLDLFVVHYVDFSFDDHTFCGDAKRDLRSYCHPDVYGGLADVLYRNEGDGTFREVGTAMGIAPRADAKGLGLGVGDFDGNGRPDVFVANDSTMNHLYVVEPDGRLRESALLAGVGYNATGAAEAGMGVAIGDLDGDGREDLFVTHLDLETNTLYRNLGHGMFADVTDASGLGPPGLPWVGFGTVAFDHDLDGDLDLVVANGHIIDNIAQFDSSRQHRQPAQLFDNRGDGRFVERTGRLGLDEPLVGRGLAAGDLDRDGDLDLVIAQNGDRVLVLRNELDAPAQALTLALRGPAGNRDAFGAGVEVESGERRQVREARAALGYLSQGSSELVFGLGTEAAVTVTVRWPKGKTARYRGLQPGTAVRVRASPALRDNVSSVVLRRRPFRREDEEPRHPRDQGDLLDDR